MKLIIKQKIITWFDSYNVYDENDNIVYIIEGKIAWGHKFIIYDASGKELGCIKEKIITLLPNFEIYKNNEKIGEIKQLLSLWKPKYVCDFEDYVIQGDVWRLQYQINKGSTCVAKINKKLLSWSDTYTIDSTQEDSFNVLLIALSIDAANCNRTFYD